MLLQEKTGHNRSLKHNTQRIEDTRAEGLERQIVKLCYRKHQPLAAIVGQGSSAAFVFHVAVYLFEATQILWF